MDVLYATALLAVPGLVTDLFVADSAGAPMRRADAVTALEGRGLDGDRYADGAGSFSRWPHPGRAVTLISAESLAEAQAEFGVTLADGEHRRNIVVEGVPLEILRGVPFQVGDARFEGWRICAPCKYLIRVSGQDQIFDALVRRGGLRAAVVTGGRVAVGDAVIWDPAEVADRARLPG